MICPKCNCECDRDSVDVGVGVIHGPWGCANCYWSEDSRYDRSEGTSPAQLEAGPTRYVDQYGGSESVDRMTERCERFGIPRKMVEKEPTP